MYENYMTQLKEEPTCNKYISDLVITSNVNLIDIEIVGDAFLWLHDIDYECEIIYK